MENMDDWNFKTYLKLIQHRRRFVITSTSPSKLPPRFCPSQGLLQPWPSLLIPNLRQVDMPLEHEFVLAEKVPWLMTVSNFFLSWKLYFLFVPLSFFLYRIIFLHTILECRCCIYHASAGLLSPLLINACHPKFLSTLPHLILPSDT